MQVYVLCDDALSLPYQAEHGLSLFIKTNSHNILFDAGRSDAFAKNAALAGIDLSEIDTVVLSHGHYDHADGLMHFLKINDRAKIYVHAEAFGDFRHGDRYIGADKRLQAYTDRMVLIAEDLAIDDTLSVVTADGLQAPQTGLLKRIGNDVFADDFAHEIYLEVSDASKKAFFTGCAHKGIVSIANFALRRGATHLIGGFHLTDMCDADFLQEAANALADIPLVYYTGHCTSQKSYDCLKRTLHTRLHHLSDQAAFAIGDHAEVARFLFRQGYNCSQAVLGAFADELGLDGELAMRLSCSFGGGMGRMREVCGAVRRRIRCIRYHPEDFRSKRRCFPHRWGATFPFLRRQSGSLQKSARACCGFSRKTRLSHMQRTPGRLCIKRSHPLCENGRVLPFASLRASDSVCGEHRGRNAFAKMRTHMLYISVQDFFEKTAEILPLGREEERACAARMRQGDEAARERLIRTYLPMIASHIKHAPQYIQGLHLVMLCVKELDSAVDTFDFLQNSESFAHRFEWQLRQIIVRHLTDARAIGEL